MQRHILPHHTLSKAGAESLAAFAPSQEKPQLGLLPLFFLRFGLCLLLGSARVGDVGSGSGWLRHGGRNWLDVHDNTGVDEELKISNYPPVVKSFFAAKRLA